MSRYPGTQFKVYDNSQATAMVPVTTTNPADAVTYLSTFASVKGPEGITLSYGNNFYDRYGTQDNVDFKKYGQPLFQASMNVNNGATILAKRAVLDDATLGNATLAVVLTKYKEVTIKPDDDNQSLIGSIEIGSNDAKYSIAPLMFSVKNDNDYKFANIELNEHKERYDLYKNYIIDVVANEDTPDNRFLSKLISANEKTGILSGFSQSVYYDSDDKAININSDGKAQVRKITSITTGLESGNQKTYSSVFDAENDIIDDDNGDGRRIDDTESAYQNYAKATGDKKADYTIMKYVVKQTGTEGNYKYSGYWDTVDGTATAGGEGSTSFKDIATKVDITRFFTSVSDLQDIVDASTWNTKDVYDAQHSSGKAPDSAFEYALLQGKATMGTDKDREKIVSFVPVTGDDIIDTTGYDNTIRLMNDLMTKASGYIISEWVFPLFSIFDNGRGESIKTIGIEYDATSSTTMKKSIYKLNVYNYATSKKLETFSFSLNPYTRNNNTGYTFDIESAVNYNSNQISVKTYYEAYDALLETLQLILGTSDNDLIGTYDILFGHALNGKYNAFSSYAVSNLLKRVTYLYDYAHLDVFDNDIITVNAYCDWENMTSQDENLKAKGYYYNWIRTNKQIIERLEFGSNGYNISRTEDTSATEFIPFIALDENWIAKPVNGDYGTSMAEIIEVTGQKNGDIISSETLNLTDIPIVPENFIKVKINMVPGELYVRDKSGITAIKKGNCFVVPTTKAKQIGRACFESNNQTLDNAKEIAQETGWAIWVPNGTSEQPYTYTSKEVFIPYAVDKIYQKHYYRFFAGEFDKDIFNLDIYFPNAVFDANYDNNVKLAIQRLAAYRGDFMCYMDMGIDKVKSYEDCETIIPSTLGGLDLTSETSEYFYVRDMHIAVTCLYYKIRNPYDNRVIQVTGTYGLSNLYISHFRNSIGDVFAGISNGITIGNIIEGTVNYIPKIYPTSEMTSLNNIGGVYPSDDSTIINEKQLMCDLRVNYGCYYDDRFSIETEYTMNPTESEFSYWNNVALVCMMMQAIRKACPAARYQFITADDLTVYKDAVETAMKPWRNKFAKITFKYVQDDAALENKIFYAAIEVVFRPFAQAEIFELTALNYSTFSSTVTNI